MLKLETLGADPEGFLRGATWRAREREPIAGVWGRSLQRGPGAEPLVRRLGGEAPLKLKAVRPGETANLPPSFPQIC